MNNETKFIQPIITDFAQPGDWLAEMRKDIIRYSYREKPVHSLCK
jgi:trimethylamine:corrinoid methyltransferase-like protein